jgi:hypothetical protein
LRDGVVVDAASILEVPDELVAEVSAVAVQAAKNKGMMTPTET